MKEKNRENKKMKKILDGKPLMAAVCIFLAAIMANVPIAIAASTATIDFTYIPPYGESGYLRGIVTNVAPADYKVACYTYVSGWWTKPTFASPLTTINSDGSWACNIVTGGSDQYSTKERAYVVPNGYNPPQMSGQEIFPADLDANAVAKKEAPRKLERIINFSGRDWIVKFSVIPTGPGLNYFSDNNDSVWVDAQGQLHLKIIKAGDTWYSSEVILKDSLGYGEYVFYIASRADQIDKNAVLGMFTWDTFAPSNNYREIDIEISRWGQDANGNSQFVVQPWYRSSNMHRFNADFGGNYSVQVFNWSAQKVSFKSLRGLNASSQNSSDLINSWDYTGSDIPPPGGENARINLWLFDPANVLGKPPSDGKEVEVVIREFKFIPPGSEIVLTPRIFVSKSVSSATLPVGGGNVSYFYKVANTGDLTLSNITLADDKCAPAVYVDGDANSNSQLETTETWNYACEMRINETTINIATVTGNYSESLVSDSDTSTVAVAIPTPMPTPNINTGGGGFSTGSSGGGGGGISGENYSNIELKERVSLHLYKDKITLYKFEQTKSIPVRLISITGNINAGEIITTVELLRDKSSLLQGNESAPGTVFRNINIWVGGAGFATSKNIQKAVINFRVDKAWIESNQFANSDIKLVRWDGKEWVMLETKEVAGDNTHVYFEAKTVEFSHFAIIGIKPEPAQIVMTVPPQAQAIPAATIAAPALTESSATPKQASGFFLMGAILAIALVYILRRKNNKL